MLRITKTENGMVKGLPGTDARITVFKGIPYAADTSGKNRWRAPQPVENWEGVRNCFEFSPITMQAVPGKNPEAFYAKEWHVDPEVPMGEDSLTVNIWTNAKTGKEKMPVFVWIFGGGLNEGYAYEMEFDGERLASRDVVVVTVGYRVNVFGFMSHPDITKEAPDAAGNFGFLDQQAALKWVQRNIANFGGDPDNVTLGGQSAGGVSVFAQMCAPSSKGLFKRAIIQSSAGGSVCPVCPNTHNRHAITLAQAEAEGVDFLENQLGVKTIEEARQLPAQFIMDKFTAMHKWMNRIVDGTFLTKDIDEYVFSGEVNQMPMIIGYTEDEVPLIAQGENLDEIGAWARKVYEDRGDKIVEVWKQSGEDVENIKTVSKTNCNEISTLFVAEEYSKQGNDVYCYSFDPTIPGDDAGAFHSCDLWFTFETLMKCWRPFDGHHYDMARKMCNYWTNFMKNGDPNGCDKDGTPMPEWEKYTSDNQDIMQFFDDITLREGPISEFRQIVVDKNLEVFRDRFGK